MTMLACSCGFTVTSNDTLPIPLVRCPACYKPFNQGSAAAEARRDG